MDEYELTIECSTKGSDEIKEKAINVNLQEYQESYADNVFHLQQQYSKSEVNKFIRPAKEEFIFDYIIKYLNENEKLESLIDPLIDEIDKYITETNE